MTGIQSNFINIKIKLSTIYFLNGIISNFVGVYKLSYQ